MLGRHKPQEPVRLSVDDFKESAIIYVRGDVLVDEKILNRLISKYYKQCSWRGNLPIDFTIHSAGSEDGLSSLHLKTYHRQKDISCSVTDWHEHFSRFLLFVIREQKINFSLVRYMKFDNQTEYWQEKL